MNGNIWPLTQINLNCIAAQHNNCFAVTAVSLVQVFINDRQAWFQQYSHYSQRIGQIIFLTIVWPCFWLLFDSCLTMVWVWFWLLFLNKIFEQNCAKNYSLKKKCVHDLSMIDIIFILFCIWWCIVMIHSFFSSYIFLHKSVRKTCKLH